MIQTFAFIIASSIKMAFTSLTSGCLVKIMNGIEFDKPIVQVLGSKRLPGAGGSTRYRLLVSDGETVISYAMLASQLHTYGDENALTEYTIIRIEKCIMSLASREKKVLIILDLTVLHPGADVKTKIGNPAQYIFPSVQETTPIKNDPISVPSTNNTIGSIVSGAAIISSGTAIASSGETINSSVEMIDPSGGSIGCTWAGTVSESNNAGSSDTNVEVSPTTTVDTISTNPLPSTSCGFGVITSSNNPTTSTPNTSATHVISPITSLSPYQNKWMIKARVISKTNVKTYHNGNGTGKLFSMDLIDQSGEIKATGFNNAVDKYYEMIEVGKVYFISKCVLKSANKKFTTLSNDYEMTFTYNTNVEVCPDAVDTIPNVVYNFVPFSQISQKKANDSVDVIGICYDVEAVTQITARKTGRYFKKREITLVDSTLHSVNLTLWGDDAETFDVRSKSVIVIKSGKINDFHGRKSINLAQGSFMKINPDIHEAHKLRGWYDSEGSAKDYSNISNTVTIPESPDWMNFYETKLKNLGTSDKPDFFQCKATIYTVKHSSCVYKSCPKSGCYKKVVDQENGIYNCVNCNSNSSDFKYRLLLNALIVDWTSNRWVTIFSDQSEKLLEVSSDEVGRAFDENKDKLESILSKIHFKSCIFKFRTQVESYNDCQRMKINVLAILPVNHKEYNTDLVAKIKNMTVGKMNPSL